MKKIFISQPMNNIPEEKVLELRRRIFNAFVNKYDNNNEYVLIDQWTKNPPEGARRVWYLGDSIALMDQADMIIFAPGWSEAIGCVIEHDVAVNYHRNYCHADYNMFGELIFERC